MGKIDTDYLWLHEQPPRPTSRLRRLALILVIPLIGGAAWFTASPQSGLVNFESSQVSDNDSGDADDDTAAGASVDASVGTRSNSEPADDVDARRAEAEQRDDDIALSEHDEGAAQVAVAPINDERTIADDAATAAGTESGTRWHDVTIRQGDTLSIAFNRNDLSYADSLKIAHLDEYGNRFTRGLRDGDTMRVKADEDGSVLAVDFPVDALNTLQVRADGNQFVAEMASADVDHRKAYATGTIDTSFYVDALEAGLSDNQIMQLVKIFGWDIDFVLDIRPGDRFVVLYEELYREGDKVADGDILAASFVNRGRDVRAVRFEEAGDDQGTVYYSPEGRAMKKAFIRTPVDYARISSGFNLSRKHPILNRIRRHEGTDYAASTGTPIKATGNGRVVFRGRRGGYGNMIIIKHDKHLSTRYGHMSKFASNIGVGSKVRQGDVIGYVGMTGLATGPHLHYEFRVDGQPKDPERVKLPKANPLPDAYMDDFESYSAPLLSQIDALTRTNVAQADDGERESASN